jgi:hypothetical protein
LPDELANLPEHDMKQTTIGCTGAYGTFKGSD